jgi:hypothetical protein
MTEAQTQCQQAIDDFSTFAANFHQLVASRQQLVSSLFQPTGGDWTGPDASSFQQMLSAGMANESLLDGRAQDLIAQMNGLLRQLQQLGL